MKNHFKKLEIIKIKEKQVYCCTSNKRKLNSTLKARITELWSNRLMHRAVIT